MRDIKGYYANISLIRTDNTERMRELLSSFYKARSFEAPGAGKDFFGRANRLQLNRIGLSYTACNTDVRIGFPELDTFRHQMCLAGAGETIADGERAPLSPDDSCVIPLGSKADVGFAAHYCQLLLTIHPAALQRKFEALTGERPTADFQFQLTGSFRSPRLAHLRRLILFLVEELDRPDSHLSPIALAEFEQAIIVAFLRGHDHNYLHLLEKPAASAAPWQVRLTEAYIEANWDKPLSIVAISEAVGANVRSIFLAFKQSRAYSPTTFLRRTRLREARDMLSRAEGEPSVMMVAYACGFRSHGHFAREYRLQFGEAPSDTLARARGM